MTLGTRYAFPVLFPDLRSAFGFDLSTLGALYTLLWVTYAVGQFPAGLFGDRLGDRRMLVFSAALSAGALSVVGLATGPGPLVVGAFLFGATSALYGPARFTIMTRIYSEYDGTAIGLTQSAGHVGNTVIPAGAGIIAATLSWRIGFLYTIPLFLIAAAGLWIVIPDDADTLEGGRDGSVPSVGSIREIVVATLFPLTLTLTTILAIQMFVIQGATGFYPTYLIQEKGLPPATAATLFGLLFASGAATQPLTGALGDAVGTRRALLLVLGALVASLPLITVATTVPHLVAVTVLLSSAFGISPIVIPRLTAALPAAIRGSGLGLLRTGYFLVASFGSFVVGSFAERGLFDESFFLLGALAVVAFALAALIDRDSG